MTSIPSSSSSRPNSPTGSWSDGIANLEIVETQPTVITEPTDYLWSNQDNPEDTSNFSITANSQWWPFAELPTAAPTNIIPTPSPTQVSTTSLISSGWPLDLAEAGPAENPTVNMGGQPPISDLFNSTKSTNTSLLLPFVSFNSIEDLKSRGLLNDIPLRFVSNMPAIDLDKIERTNLAETQMTYHLLKAGYDIRLGERGRSSLKQEISKRTKILTDIKDTCFSTITRLKQANIYQLVQFSEICGILDRALEISQTYWRKYSRRQRTSRPALSPEGEDLATSDEKKEPEEAVKTDESSQKRNSRSHQMSRRVRRKKHYSEESSSDHSLRRKRADRRRRTARGDLLTSLPISAEFTQSAAEPAIKSEIGSAVLPSDDTTASFQLLEQLLLQAALNPGGLPDPESEGRREIQDLVESLVKIIAEKVDPKFAVESQAAENFEATLCRMSKNIKDSESLREALQLAQQKLTKGLEAASNALEETNTWSTQRLESMIHREGVDNVTCRL